MLSHSVTRVAPSISAFAAVVLSRFSIRESPISDVLTLAVLTLLPAHRVRSTIPARKKISGAAMALRAPELWLQ